MKRAFWILPAVAMGISLVSVGMAQQAGGKQKSEATKAITSGKLRGPDPNVKHPGETNNASTGKHAVVPKWKIKAKPHGKHTSVPIDNRTASTLPLNDLK